MKKLLVFLSLMQIASMSLGQTNKIIFSDSTLILQEYLVKEFGEDMRENLVEMEGRFDDFTVGFISLENILEEKSERNPLRVTGHCLCYDKYGTIEASNAFGFMSGMAILLNINTFDSTFTASLFYHTDGAKSHKLTLDGEYIENIKVKLDNPSLVLFSDSDFSANGKIIGRLTGTTPIYYEASGPPPNPKEIQMKIISVFECVPEKY